MMAWLSQWLQNIILLVLLATFADLLLPSSNMQKYAKMVLGLLVIVAILSPILELFTNKYPFDQFIKSIETEMNQTNAVNAMSQIQEQQIEEDTKKQMIDQVENSMEKELKTYLESSSLYSVEDIDLKAENNNHSWKIQQLGIYLSQNKQKKSSASVNPIQEVEGIRIQINDVQSTDKQDIKQNSEQSSLSNPIALDNELKGIISFVTKEWGVKEENIKIYLN